jgi:hypothetical protein
MEEKHYLSSNVINFSGIGKREPELPKFKVEENVLNWLLEPSQPAVRYRALVDLLDRSADDDEVIRAHSFIPKRGWAFDILREQRKDGRWAANEEGLYHPKYLATNWRAIVLADLGVTAKNPQMKLACELFFKEWYVKGDFPDKELCIVGNFARTMTRCGYAKDPRIKLLFEWLVESQKADGGWHCFKSDSGTLDCWEGLSAYASLPRNQWTKGIKRSVERGAEFYLERELFNEGSRYAPWFRLHYPVHYYYDILVGLDTITALGFEKDKRLSSALDILLKKRRKDGKWELEAIHPDIGHGANYRQRKKATPFILEQKGQPSKWITLTALCVIKRIQDS